MSHNETIPKGKSGSALLCEHANKSTLLPCLICLVWSTLRVGTLDYSHLSIGTYSIWQDYVPVGGVCLAIVQDRSLPACFAAHPSSTQSACAYKQSMFTDGAAIVDHMPHQICPRTQSPASICCRCRGPVELHHFHVHVTCQALLGQCAAPESQPTWSWRCW